MKLSRRGKKPGTAEVEVNPLEGLRAVQVGASQTLPGIRWFPNDVWRLIPAELPEALVGTRESLRRLCQYLNDWQLERRFVDRAIFVITGVGERPLGEPVRDELWRIFGVPVFELFVARDGVILAHECEAHEGWHVNSAAAEFVKLRGEPHLVLRRPLAEGGHTAIGVGFSGTVTRRPCPCGLETQRVVNLPASELNTEEGIAAAPLEEWQSGRPGGPTERRRDGRLSRKVPC